MIEGVRVIAESAIAFDYLICLSGQDYPIKSNEQIKSFLQQHKGNSFMRFYSLPYEGQHPWGGVISQRLTRIEYWHIRRGDFYIRLPLKWSNYMNPLSIKRSPLWLFLNLLLPRKRTFIKGFTPYGGSQWWCLTKTHVLYINDFIRRNKKFVDFFRYVHYSDEIFFQTILLNSKFKDEVFNDDLRYIDWSTRDTHPKVLTENDFESVSNSQQLFARKFDQAHSCRIIEMIDQLS